MLPDSGLLLTAGMGTGDRSPYRRQCAVLSLTPAAWGAPQTPLVIEEADLQAEPGSHTKGRPRSSPHIPQVGPRDTAADTIPGKLSHGYGLGTHDAVRAEVWSCLSSLGRPVFWGLEQHKQLDR